MRVEFERNIAASPERVWQLLTNWERQPEWMLDAIAVHVLTPQRAGEGVTLRCPTRMLGITVQDVLRVTGWDPPHYLEVAHLGRVITGRGAFELAAEGGGTQVRWWEEVDPPLGVVGAVGARVLVGPIIRAVFTRSLARFAALCEEGSA